ncbi:hypothetical protein [Dactylosporangium sp. CA-139066]|uniref:hypothetical protein n=1 Tax=Dactylosporangium sp. CA-139066 TaxID=3239930 RepID=UPI003D94E248
MSLAVYQPIMEPHGFWTDPATGAMYPVVASNNTYWPRDIRQTAILVAFAAVILICRANLRAILVAAAGTAVWIAADLVLDRVDVHGSGTAAVLAGAGAAAFAVTALVARRLSTGEPGGERTVHLTATMTAVLGALTLLVTTPWEEPVTDPAKVRVENALTLLEVALAVACAAVAAGLIRPAGWRRVAVFGAVAALAAWSVTAVESLDGLAGLVVLPVTAAAAVAAARDTPLWRLLVAAAGGAVLMLPAFLIVYLIGSALGAAMTSAASSPPVNSADTDLALPFAAVVCGLILAGITGWVTGPAFNRSAPVPTQVP